MNEFQEIFVSEVHAGNFVFVFSCKSVEFNRELEFNREFECLGLFGGCVCCLGLTAEQVQGAAV